MKLSMILCAALAIGWPATAGQHHGERDKLRATVAFLDPVGSTTADAAGTTFSIPQWNWTYHDSTLVYAPNCRGTVPLYLAGAPMSFEVTLANVAAHGSKPFKVRVQAISSTLRTDCAPGIPLADQEYVVDDLRPGETRTLRYSVNLGANLPGGLDVTKVRVLHANQGEGDAGLIVESEAYWCPPNLRDSRP